VVCSFGRQERGRSVIIRRYIMRKGHEVTRKELIKNPPFSESTVKSIQEDILSDRKDKKYLGE